MWVVSMFPIRLFLGFFIICILKWPLAMCCYIVGGKRYAKDVLNAVGPLW